MRSWEDCKNILCIRPDNMGDLVMTVPAIRALKESYRTRITVLISSMAARVAAMIPEIDDVIVCDVPWVKASNTLGPEAFNDLTENIKAKGFDGAVIFTVYSQNPMPAIMLAWLAGIPRRLAYCRENPYMLLTDWVPDKEPYTEIKHQVRRDLNLVKYIRAFTSDEKLSLKVDEELWPALKVKLENNGISPDRPWLILHPGVSEEKREYPVHLWIETGRALAAQYQLLVTGGPAETGLSMELSEGIGVNAFSLAGRLSLGEFVLLIKRSALVISVNTGTVHLAAALQTPQIVLYALSNPQHFPWRGAGKVLTFDVPEDIKSRNEVIRFVNKTYFSLPVPMIMPGEIIETARKILSGQVETIPELPF